MNREKIYYLERKISSNTVNHLLILNQETFNNRLFKINNIPENAIHYK